jgi:hypothetical protein
VGDLQNTGMIRLDPDSDLGRRMRAAGAELPPYVTNQHLTELLDRYGRTTLPPSPEGYAEGGPVVMGKREPPPLFDAQQQARAPIGSVLANHERIGGQDSSMLDAGVAHRLGDSGHVNFGASSSKADAPGGGDAYMNMLRAGVGGNVGGIGLNANLLKLLDVDDVYLGMVNGSIPVGLGQLLLSVRGVRSPHHTGETARSVGYAQRLGPGQLQAAIVQPKRGKPQGMLQYAVPFATGGAVMRDAADEFNPATIATLADALSKELA